MPTRRQRQVVRQSCGWALLVVAGLAVADAVTVARWFVLVLVGVLVVVHRSTALHASPRWRRGLRPILVAGLALFVALIAVDAGIGAVVLPGGF